MFIPTADWIFTWSGSAFRHTQFIFEVKHRHFTKNKRSTVNLTELCIGQARARVMNEKESSWVWNSNRRLKLANVVSIKNRWSSRTKTFYIKSWKYFQFCQSLLEIIEYQELNSQRTFLRAQSLNILKPFAVLDFNFLIYAVKGWRIGPSYTPTSSALRTQIQKKYVCTCRSRPCCRFLKSGPTTRRRAKFVSVYNKV